MDKEKGPSGVAIEEEKMAVISRKLKEVGAEAYNIRDIKRNAPNLLTRCSIADLEAKSGEDIEAMISNGLDGHYALR